MKLIQSNIGVLVFLLVSPSANALIEINDNSYNVDYFDAYFFGGTSPSVSDISQSKVVGSNDAVISGGDSSFAFGSTFRTGDEFFPEGWDAQWSYDVVSLDITVDQNTLFELSGT